MKGDNDYNAGANLTYEVVRNFRVFGSGVPEFAFPPRHIALIASLKDIGDKLCRNDAAREMLQLLFAACDYRKLSDYPTAMMLRVALDAAGIPITFVPFEELGIKGKMVPMGQRGQS